MDGVVFDVKWLCCVILIYFQCGQSNKVLVPCVCVPNVLLQYL